MTFIQNYDEKKIENEDKNILGNKNSPPKNSHEAEENLRSPPTWIKCPLTNTDKTKQLESEIQKLRIKMGKNLKVMKMYWTQK